MRRQSNSNTNKIIKYTKKCNVIDKPNYSSLENEIKRNFIIPYNKLGCIGLPNMLIFQKYCELLGTKYTKTKSMQFKIYKDLISIILDTKNIYISNIKLENESKVLRNYKHEALEIINNLKMQTHDFDNTDTTFVPK